MVKLLNARLHVMFDTTECQKEVVNQSAAGSPDDIHISMAEEARDDHRPSFDISSRLEEKNLLYFRDFLKLLSFITLFFLSRF